MQAPDQSASLLTPIGKCLDNPKSPFLCLQTTMLQLFAPVVEWLDEVHLDVVNAVVFSASLPLDGPRCSATPHSLLFQCHLLHQPLVMLKDQQIL
jgi:hypothetical protein